MTIANYAAKTQNHLMMVDHPKMPIRTPRCPIVEAVDTGRKEYVIAPCLNGEEG